VRLGARLLVLVLLAVLAVATPACKRSQAAASQDPESVSLVVRADTEGLLLTWIDDKGDFHVETRVADVPMMGRDAVRVVDPSREDGTHADRVFVVDLRQARADGTYPVRAMSRADFEALAVARRQEAGPTLAAAGPPSSTAAQDPAGGAPTPGTKPAGRAVVIIYGAEWCGACHDAARYLRSKGIDYVEKDIEKDPVAAREMKQKLAQNGLRAGSIPVIDVRGKVFVGFNPHEVDDALGTAL
jgi:glutaredoxin